MSDVTWQEGLFHGLHQALQVMFYIVHHNVDLIHVAPDNDLLSQQEVEGWISLRPSPHIPGYSSKQFFPPPFKKIRIYSHPHQHVEKKSVHI